MDTHEDYAALRHDKPGQERKKSKKRQIAAGLAGVSKLGTY
jgi:hypothetical protein